MLSLIIDVRVVLYYPALGHLQIPILVLSLGYVVKNTKGSNETMAQDMFMKIDTVDGESKDSVHQKEIDVLAWSWGYSNSGSAQVGGGAGAGAGKVNVQALSFTKWVDSATPKLALACFSGQPLKEAILVVRTAGAQPVEYLKINMVDVLIASASTGGSSGEDRLTENVTLNFAKVALDYVPQDDKGVAKTAIPMTWNILENVSIPRTSLTG